MMREKEHDLHNGRHPRRLKRFSAKNFPEQKGMTKEGAWFQSVVSGKVNTLIYHPAVYRVIVFYNDVEYEANEKEVYDKYKDRVGEIVNATIEKNSYDDGTVKCLVIALE